MKKSLLTIAAPAVLACSMVLTSVPETAFAETNTASVTAQSSAEVFTWPGVVHSTVSFRDVNASFWAKTDIDNLSSRGIIQGSGGYFKPNDLLTRGQASAILGRLQQWNNTPQSTSFKDVGSSYFASSYISYGSQRGYFNGFEDNTFRPNDDMTRAQAAAVLNRMYQFTSSGDTSNTFRDVNASTTGAAAIGYLAQNDIITGYPDGSFRPNDKITRAQFSKIMNKLGTHLTGKVSAEQSNPPKEQVGGVHTNVIDNVIASGESYIGTPYLFGAASTTTAAFDCSSFTQRVFAENGITLPRTSRQQYLAGTRINRSDLKKGDLVFFDTNKDGSINHVSIYIDSSTLFHATLSRGVNYTSFSNYWNDGYVGAVRMTP